MQIFVMKNDERLGPFSLEEVNRRLAAGTLNPIDEAWFEGSPGWKPLLGITGVIMPGGASSSAEPLTIAHPATIGSTSYAGFLIRTLAYLIDSLILVIIYEIIVRMLLLFPPSDLVVMAIEILPIVIFGVYMTLFWSSSMQATLGQKVCGVKVINAITGRRISFARAIARYFALLLAMSILGIGVVMVAFTERKRGLHDVIADTYVVKDRELPVA
jgi:uncharacterized RDD family membrane protein YckC